MYWYYAMIVAAVLLLLGGIQLGGCNLFLRKAFRSQGWTAFCRKEFAIHTLVIGGLYGLLGYAFHYFDFTAFESGFWVVLMLLPTVSDFHMLNKKYKALVK